MGLFQKNKKQDIQPKSLQEIHRENIQPKSLQEIYREKTRQLREKRAELDREREQLEQSTDISSMEAELPQIQQSMEDIRIRNKKHWRRFVIVWVIAIVLIVGGRIGCSAYAEFKGKEELESYKQQLEAELVQYSEDAEIQKQELQLQIEELESYKQQLEAEFVQYSEDAEIQKQELQLQIEELTGKQGSLTQ